MTFCQGLALQQSMLILIEKLVWAQTCYCLPMYTYIQHKKFVFARTLLISMLPVLTAGHVSDHCQPVHKILATTTCVGVYLPTAATMLIAERAVDIWVAECCCCCCYIRRGNTNGKLTTFSLPIDLPLHNGLMRHQHLAACQHY